MKTINYKNKTIHFIPTAHVSKESVKDVIEAIDTIQPDAILIELDRKRAQGLMSEEKSPDMDIKTIIKNKEFASFSAQLLLSTFQKKIAQDLDTEVGAEMKAAITEADRYGIPKYYIDRDINITMQRLWGGLGIIRKANFVVSLLLSSFGADDEEIDIEALKNSDLLYSAIGELETKVPHLAKVILHERNEYMAQKIISNYHTTLLVVIGAAHTEGIIESFDKEIDMKELRSMPPKKKFNLIEWLFPITLVLLFATLFIKSPEAGTQELFRWFLLSSGLSSLGALLVGSHPLTILATIVGAPIGILSPVLAVGFFSGLAEAYMRPPTVKDFENLSEDSSNWKMWFKNKFLRILVIMLVTTILSSIGTFISGGSIIKQLF